MSADNEQKCIALVKDKSHKDGLRRCKITTAKMPKVIPEGLTADDYDNCCPAHLRMVRAGKNIKTIFNADAESAPPTALPAAEPALEGGEAAGAGRSTTPPPPARLPKTAPGAPARKGRSTSVPKGDAQAVKENLDAALEAADDVPKVTRKGAKGKKHPE